MAKAAGNAPVPELRRFDTQTVADVVRFSYTAGRHCHNTPG
jgi:hypothetical protein